MRDSTKLALLIACALFGSAILMAAVMVDVGSQVNVRQEAIHGGHAKYVLNDQTGVIEFQWIKRVEAVPWPPSYSPALSGTISNDNVFKIRTSQDPHIEYEPFVKF